MCFKKDCLCHSVCIINTEGGGVHHILSLLVLFEYFVSLQNLEMCHGDSHGLEFVLNLRSRERQEEPWWVSPQMLTRARGWTGAKAGSQNSIGICHIGSENLITGPATTASQCLH